MKTLYPLTASCCLKVIAFIFLSLPFTSNAQEYMRANLYVVDANGTTLVDGNLTNYNNVYSNAVDINDAWKMANPGINFGILRESYDLVVERRSLIGLNDTTYFRMWNMPQYNYRIRFVLKNLNHPGLKAVIKDNYLNTETTVGLNDTTYFDFSVDANAASSNTMRFQLIFGQNSSVTPVDVSFTGIQAQRKGKDVSVEWNVAGEISMRSYTIEHSTDGRAFDALHQVAAQNTPVAKTYTYKDPNASLGVNFYRIKGLSIDGKVQYSNVARINAVTIQQEISVYPNPVTNKTVQLQFNNLTAGTYNIVLISNNGTQVNLPSMKFNEGQGNATINLPKNLPPAIYQLQLTGPGNSSISKSILVL